MIAESLVSIGPNPDIPLSDLIFAPFIGSWDLRITWYAEQEIVRQENGEWHFDWVLEGRAIQDVWIVPRRDERASTADLYEYGTSVRFYEPRLGAWRSTWIGPMHGMVRTFVARKQDETVTMETDPDQGDALQWVFSDISSDAFVWRNSIWLDGVWILQQAFVATRMRRD
jgi:hypothetical protein